MGRNDLTSLIVLFGSLNVLKLKNFHCMNFQSPANKKHNTNFHAKQSTDKIIKISSNL